MFKKIYINALVVMGMLVLFNSCKKEYESIESIDDAKIQAYKNQYNLQLTKDPSGFYYQLVTEGTGAVMLNKDSVLYNLTIKSLTGEVYYTTPAYRNEGGYLGYMSPKAYLTALTGVKRGSTVRVIVPSYLAFGKNGSAGIPSNEVIVTEISTYSETTQRTLDENRIAAFIAANNLTAVKSPVGVSYIVSQVGTGATIDLASTITVKYTGRYLNGVVFDQSGTSDLVTQLSKLISGWEVLVGMKKGTKIRIFVPSGLGYGLNTQSGILESSCLDFDIEVVDVT